MTSTTVRHPVRRLRWPFRHDWLSAAGTVVLVLLLFAAIFGPLLPVGSADLIGVGPRMASPSSRFIAGTDPLGRSLLPRLLEGLGTTFTLAGLSVLATSLIGVVLGLVAAYYRGVVGEVITRAADVLFSFPGLLLAVLVVAVTGPGDKGAIISIVLLSAPLMIRVVRAAALGVVTKDFIVAARVGGARGPRIIVVHVLPNVIGPAIVQFSYGLSIGMLIESGLSFVGLGVQPPSASLGSLVHDGATYLSTDPTLVLFPGLLLALAIVSVNLVGDGLRDLFDVRASEARQ